MFKPELEFLGGCYAICRLSAASDVPQWAIEGGFFSITRTADELSVVCGEESVPEGIVCVKGYIALKVRGPLDFSLTGILSSLSAVLAEANVSIFALSTYDTDYILLREADKESASKALAVAGYVIRE